MTPSAILTYFRDGRFVESLKRVFINGVVASPFVPRRARRVLLRSMGIGVGKRCYLFDGIRFNSTNVTFGNRVSVNHGCIFDRGAPIVLEDNVRVGFRVTFLTISHRIGPPEERSFGMHAEPIHVGRGSWINTGATILPGVTIAPGCVVLAHSVVTKDCDVPNAMYGGTPAKLIRMLDEA